MDNILEMTRDRYIFTIEE